MCARPAWLPDLMRLEDCGGQWDAYCEAVYRRFHQDFIADQPQFRGAWVRCRRDPLYDGKEAGFWHCVQQGRGEDCRTPDPRRCERIAWVRAVIEHAADATVEVWETTRQADRRCVLWYSEEYVVVLGERQSRNGYRYMQLITAYCTDREHTRRKLRRERDAAKNG